MIAIKKAAGDQPAANDNGTRTVFLSDHIVPQTPPPTQTQHNNALAIADQANAAMDAAERSGDVPAWVAAFTAYLDVWPLAFANAMEAAL